MLMIDSGEVPEGEFVVPIGVADVKRQGTEITIVATGWMGKKSLAAAEQLAAEGISAEVVDPRSLAPLDVESIVNSVKKTGRLMLVDQAPRHSSAAAIIAAEVSEHGFEYLRAPIKMITALDTSIPYSEPLENYVLPNEAKIVQAAKSVLMRQVVAA
jgi:pyruvate/2-oxoglutarate/acetoin dehydrogenase E1 component